MVFSLNWQTTRRMGQSRWIDDDQIQRKWTTSFPCYESIVPRNALQQRWWKIINTLLCRWGYGWNCFSHSYFCYSAQICVMNTRLVKQERRDPCWQDNLTHCLCQQSSLLKTPTPSAAQEDLLQKYKARVERLSRQNRVIKICTDAGFLTTVEVGQY